MSDAIELTVPAPPYHVAESMLFAHPTRMADAWNPLPERILQPAYDVDGGEIRIEVNQGVAAATPLRSRNPFRRPRPAPAVDLADKFVFDGRFETDKNVAHQIDNVAAPLLLAKKSLAAILGEEPEIHIVLRAEAGRLGREIHRLLGTPVVLSDGPVQGRIVRVSHPFTAVRCEGKIVHKANPAIVSLFPEIYYKPFVGDSTPDLSEKVFIARKSTRFLINDAEISSLLTGRGFKKYYFEDIPMSQQWEVVAHARQIVSIHGAALATLVFNHRGRARKPGDLGGLQVIELFGPGYRVDGFRRSSAALNSQWCAVRGKITPDVVRDLDVKRLPRSHEKSSFSVDPGCVEMALEYSERRATQWNEPRK